MGLNLAQRNLPSNRRNYELPQYMRGVETLRAHSLNELKMRNEVLSEANRAMSQLEMRREWKVHICVLPLRLQRFFDPLHTLFSL